MTVTFQAEPFVAALPDIIPLVDPHWEEVGSFRDKFTRAIDYAAYEGFERVNRLMTITAREDRELIGYVIGIFGLDLHRVSATDPPRRIVAFSALVNFILANRRWWGRSLVKATEREAIARGATFVSFRAKKENNAGRFYELMGYEEMETTYTKIVSMPASPDHSIPSLTTPDRAEPNHGSPRPQ